MNDLPSDHPAPSSSSLCCASLERSLGVPVSAPPDGSSLSIREMLTRLRRAGVRPALEICQSLEELSVAEDAAGVIAFVDAGVLWNWNSATSISVPNHAVRLLEVERAAEGGEITSVLVEDPLRPDAPVRLDAKLMIAAWLRAGGALLVAAGRNRTN